MCDLIDTHNFRKKILINRLKRCYSVIQKILSPFSSLALLVCKKDETWQFYVDYRTLNAVTNMDRFPLPTVDELLN